MLVWEGFCGGSIEKARIANDVLCSDDDSEDDSLLELVSEDGFGFDGIRSGGAVSGGGTQV